MTRWVLAATAFVLAFGSNDANAARTLLADLVARPPAGSGEPAMSALALEACMRRAQELDRTGTTIDYEIAAARANVLKFGDGGIVIFLFLLIEREFRLEFFCQLFVARDLPLELNERGLIIAADHRQLRIELILQCLRPPRFRPAISKQSRANATSNSAAAASLIQINCSGRPCTIACVTI